MMNTKLFNEFTPVSSKQWKQKIQFDLNGADYNNTLIWQTNDSISVKPFYHSDDCIEWPSLSVVKTSIWQICETIYVVDVAKSNLRALNYLKKGAESIKFIIPDPAIAIETLLKNIDTTSIPIHLEFQFLSESYIAKLPTVTGIRTHTDIIGHLARHGNWFSTLNNDFKQFEAIVKITHQFSVDVALYQNSGANMVQQLAYALSHANEYLNHLDRIIDNESKPSLNCIFNVSIGSNHFFEIAKLRALRILWKTLATEYKVDPSCHIYTSPSKRNKTLYDYNSNMLRTTTECMSAILGGSDTICNVPFDGIYHKNNEFANRMARNQLLILKYESYFDKVNNPAEGAYYIESITHQLAEKALELFKSIESHGGFLKQLKNGTIQRKIKDSAEKEQQQFNAGDLVLTGTNKHVSVHDRMKDTLELYPFVKTHPRKTLIEPLIEKRLSETLEQERLKKE